MSLCSYVQNKQDYVFMFLCLKQTRLCLYVENKNDLSLCPKI